MVNKSMPCHICGQTALYYASGKGFCRTHRVEATKADARKSRSANSVRTYEKMRYNGREHVR